MKNRFTITVMAAAVLLAGGSNATDIDAGITIGDGGIKGFYLAIGEHYDVPEKEIVVVRKQSVPDEQLPVVFFLARKGGVSPETIIKLRLGGKSWMEITAHLGLAADIFYVPTKRPPGPPYGKAYGHFKNKKKDQWHTVKLSDVEIVDLVNLSFISAHYGCSADDVIELRAAGKSFVDINTHVKAKKKAKAKAPAKTAPKHPDKPKGKGKKK